ncbi:LysR family transcriptional regulator [Pseudomonas sp. BN607]|uniref:LysR family transcriptional regulator n=1 Tax=Pseudomonas sp. BN607 TaxID=2567895 RepID=UPI0024570515|nr:LysR family transcriptional regulator [Pseudomonas sp. BN607]
MDIFNAINVFVHVADKGSQSAAADSLHCSKPQVSRVLCELEQHLQVKLIHRTTRQQALTDAGARFLQRCRLLLEDLESAQLEAVRSRQEVAGTLRMHAPNGIGKHYIIPLIAEFRHQHPDLSIDLTLNPTPPDMLAGGYDVVILDSCEIPDSAFICQTLGRSYSVICGAPEYLARRSVPHTLSDLYSHTCLELDDAAFPHGWEIAGLDVAKFELGQQAFKTNLADGVAEAAKAGLGLALLPGHAAAAGIRSGELIRVLPDVQAHHRGITALYPSRRFLSANVRKWIEYLKVQIPARQQKDNEILSRFTRSDLSRPALHKVPVYNW